jgi:hypothetical protein
VSAPKYASVISHGLPWERDWGYEVRRNHALVSEPKYENCRTHFVTHTHTHTRTWDQLVEDAATYTKPNTWEEHPCPQCDSNPRSQQSSGRRPKSYTAWPPGSPEISFVAVDVVALVLHTLFFFYADCAERNTQKRQHYSLCTNDVILSEPSSPATKERHVWHIMNVNFMSGLRVKLDTLYSSTSGTRNNSGTCTRSCVLVCFLIQNFHDIFRCCSVTLVTTNREQQLTEKLEKLWKSIHQLTVR